MYVYAYVCMSCVNIYVFVEALGELGMYVCICVCMYVLFIHIRTYFV
jgi:hypothetical protein